MITDTQTEKKITFPLVLLLIYVFSENARPAFLTPLHLGLVLQAVFLLLFLKHTSKIKAILSDKYFLLYLILLAEMMVHGPTADNNYWAFLQWRQMFGLFIFSIAFCLFIDTAEKLRIFLTGFVAILVLPAVDQLLFGRMYFGWSGVMGDKNDFALAMNVVTPISFFMGISHSGMRQKGFWIATLLFVIANGSVASRGGFVALAVVAGLCWLKTGGKIKYLLLISLIAVSFMSFITEDFKKEILGLDSSEVMDTGTGRERIELWKVAWRTFQENPILGVGQGNLPWKMGDYQSVGGVSFFERHLGGKAVHSIYLTVLAELGLVGTIVWVSMIRNIYGKYRSFALWGDDKEGVSANHEAQFLRNSMHGLSIGLVGSLVGGVFLSSFYYPHSWILAALIIASYLITTKMARESAASSHNIMNSAR